MLCQVCILASCCRRAGRVRSSCQGPVCVGGVQSLQEALPPGYVTLQVTNIV
jgi:hypothetical protein